MTSCIYGWIGQKSSDDLVDLIWRQDKIWTSGKTLVKKMKESYKPSDNYMKYRRKLCLLGWGMKTLKTYTELREVYKLCEMKMSSGLR